jgi:amino acid transporter
MQKPSARPDPLTVPDAIAIVIGIVIGAGIFKTPAIVAANAGSEAGVLAVWIAGGVISLLGALCYGELASACPAQGGEYHYMTRAFGAAPGFLFAWARVAVIQTGSVAMLAFLIGDFAAQMLPSFSPPVFAILTIVVLTAINMAGIRQGKQFQWLLISALICGLLAIIAAGLLPPPLPSATGQSPVAFLPGKAMIFVLLTFGGWNEAAYLSAEIRDAQRNMTRVLIISIAVITVLYLAVNLALLKGLGLAAMARSEAVASDLMRQTMGENGARLIGLLVTLAALSTMNATMITGARSIYALGRDFPLLGCLGRWRQKGNTPTNAILLQGSVALLLVFAGTFMRSGFEAMVEYTAPVFWFFFLLVGLSLFVLRRRQPHLHRPFRVPLYPYTPLLFCAVCLTMLISSLLFTGWGALAGAAVLLAGLPLYLWVRQSKATTQRKENPS